jgi:diacylglycerol O-acyltransferase
MAPPPSIERLSADDRLILSVDAAWPQDVGALAVLDGQRLLGADGSLRIDAVREAIAARLHLVPRFRQRVLTPGRRLGGPLWVDAPAFDLADHVREHRLPPGSGEAELIAAVEERRRQRLDRRRPLWEMWLLPGLEGGRVGLFMRMHHIIGDGRAAMTIVAAFLDRLADPTPAPAAPWRPGHRPAARALRRDHLERRLRGLGAGTSVLRHPVALVRRLFGMLPEMRELLAEKPGADTSLNRVIGPSRRLALIRASAIDLRHVARLHGATVNDVLLTVVAAGLRAVVAARGERTDGVTMRAFVPVSLRGRLRGTVQGNRVSQMAVPLRLDIADPLRRLRWVADETAARKRRARTTLEPLFRISLVRRLMLAAIIRQRVNVTTASLTGPRQPLYLAGARVLELFPFVNLIGNQPLGVGALSYAGALEIGVVADADAYPDLDVFAAAVGADLARLVRSSADAPVAAGQVVASVPARAAG